MHLPSDLHQVSPADFMHPCLSRSPPVLCLRAYTLEVERESAARRKSFIMIFRVGAVLLYRRRREVGGYYSRVLVLWETGEIGELGMGLVDCFIPVW